MINFLWRHTFCRLGWHRYGQRVAMRYSGCDLLQCTACGHNEHERWRTP